MRTRSYSIVLLAAAFLTHAAEKLTIAPHSKGVGFTAINAIAFTNQAPDERVMQNNNFMLGSGVALGDFDGDGRIDLYFCAIDGTNRLYRNLGDWKFEDVTAAAGVGCASWHSTGACFADLDGNGTLDLLVSTLGRGVHSFIGDGRGGFRETTVEAGLTAKTGSMSLALADVDGDGDLDLYVANYGELSILRTSSGRVGIRRDGDKWVVVGPHAKRLRYENGQMEELGEPDVLYLNDGAGHFRAAPWNSEYFVDADGKPMPEPWEFGLGVQMRDIDGDGFPDIYVCNDFKSPDRMWLNDGKGHFRLAARGTFDLQSFASMGVDFADIDRDGRLDIFVVEMLSCTCGGRMRDKNSIELNGVSQWNQNSLYWNRGDGTYAEIARLSGLEASGWSWQPVFIDVDLDGFEDVLIANGNLYDTQEIDTQELFKRMGPIGAEQSRSNILRFPSMETANLAFRNRGDLRFEEVGRAWGFAATNVAQGIALADLDGDGDLDVVINCLNGPALLYRNDATAPRVGVRLRGRPPNTQGIGARITVKGDGLPTQTQETICGGRYLSGDDPMRAFAATNRMSIEVVWRNAARTVLKDVEPNRIYTIEEAGPTHEKTAWAPRRQFYSTLRGARIN